MKKISSEISLSSPELKIKWGTIDKKNPTSIYLEIGTYISPTENYDDYTTNIKNIDKSSRDIIKRKVNGDNKFRKDFIFVTDVADSRISYNKRSFISFQIHLLKGKTYSPVTFKTMVSEVGNEWSDVYSDIEKTIEENGFSCFKTKN